MCHCIGIVEIDQKIKSMAHSISAPASIWTLNIDEHCVVVERYCAVVVVDNDDAKVGKTRATFILSMENQFLI